MEATKFADLALHIGMHPTFVDIKERPKIRLERSEWKIVREALLIASKVQSEKST